MAGPKQANELVQSLTSVPNIVGGLGLSVAAAQKAFTLEYMEAVERILVMSQALMPPARPEVAGNEDEAKAVAERHEAAASVFRNLLMAMAPSRYQFTQTTVKVKMDLAQTMSMGANVGLGVNIGAVAVNASLSIGFGYDYRAAAEVTAVIDAIPPDRQVFQTLMENARQFRGESQELPERTVVDRSIQDKALEIYKRTVDGAKVPTIEDEPADTDPPQG